MHFLPITLDEVKRLGWTDIDIVIVSGDAYIDHPAFGTAVIGRTLETEGYRVAIIPQPNWRDDLRDFRKFGKPRLFFGVTSGCMDSMVNHYTAAKRLRHDDAYTPGGESGFRPDRAAYVYTRILKQLYPDTPVILGGIEGSMRRLTHYDYWDDELKPSILEETPADLLVYGMAEKVMVQIAHKLDKGESMEDLYNLPQVVYRSKEKPSKDNMIELHPFEECKKSKRKEAENYHHIEAESNKIEANYLCQKHNNCWIVVNPPDAPFTEKEMDHTFDLPYTRLPHPKYKKRGAIPAYEMIKFSVNTHRGCFGGCAFCTISAHQGKQIASRSEASILKEVQKMSQMEGFHGVISDVGGPSANMYKLHGKNRELCRKCVRFSCIQPNVCKNLESDHQHIIELYRKVAGISGVKHVYIGSGIRCDLFNEQNHGWDYFDEVVKNHVSGRLKVAPEHTSEHVLKVMRKPTFDLFLKVKGRFDMVCKTHNLRYQLIPYFISSHPGCRLEDMADLAVKMKKLGYRLEQIQDFTPTPMTLATEAYYTGFNPENMEPIFVATNPRDKQDQRNMFFYYKPELRNEIRQALLRNHLGSYIKQLGL